MSVDNPFEKFKDYLGKIKDPKDDKCWFCHKTPDRIRAEYFEYMKNPEKGFEDVELEDIIIMTYKTKKPVCASCYYGIKQNPELIQEILDRPEEEVW